MDLLGSLTGSRVRADVLAALFGARRRPWRPAELGRLTRRPHQLIVRELRRLATAGLLRTAVLDGKRHYEPDPDGPVVRELARLILQTRGRVPRIRHVLVGLRTRTIAWAVAGSAVPGTGSVTSTRGSALIVLTSAPRSLVRVQLANVADRDMEIHCMSVREWVARLEKGDVFLRRARRARKLWVLGGRDDLVSRERAEIESKKLLRSTRGNWREELSDEWDEDWDPFAPVFGRS
ncbi:MAG: hypothetical protein HYY42_05335 [Chloroflexi bacterium]|nr:hypothetical protein [Chloroflexota bacterium]MBI2983584.1 hypothetical protein [Chloroflexota bacterium]